MELNCLSPRTTLSQPILLLLCGLPFTGKTTLATALARRFGWQYISLDAINTERGLGLDGQAIGPDEWNDTYAEAYRRIEACLKNARSVIYDETNFARLQRNRLRAIADTQGAATHVVYIAVPEPEARRRWIRNRSTRKRGDIRDDDFVYVAQRFEPPASDEAAITCESTQSVPEWIDLVVRSLKLP
jgi:predicted kinase